MPTLTIAALGPTQRHVTAAVQQAVQNAKRLVLQTENHPAVEWIKNGGLVFETMDELYTAAYNFDNLNESIARKLFEKGDTVYAVPGGGIAGSAQMKAIAKAAQNNGFSIKSLPGIGYADAAVADAGLLAMTLFRTGLRSLPATELITQDLDVSVPLAVEEITSELLAGEVKLQLLDYYPDELSVYFARIDKAGRYVVHEINLFELDRQSKYDSTTCVLLPTVPLEKLQRYGFSQLLSVMDNLRDPGGCPWDREQTHRSIKNCLIEECYEVLEAIDAGDDAALCEELGDVLLQVVFHVRMAKERSSFNFRDVTSGLVSKLIYRHPHIFSNIRADTSDAVLRNWEQLKKKEKKHGSQSEVMLAVPKNFPALMRAQKVQKKAANVGFDWDSPQPALDKVKEEADELLSELQKGADPDEELGDLLFAVVNVARLCGRDAELLLYSATDKFIRRFESMEKQTAKLNLSIDKLTLDQLNELWEQVKCQE